MLGTRTSEWSNQQRELARVAILSVLAGVIVAAAFWPVLSAQAVFLDDDRYLVGNPSIRNPSWTSAGRLFGEVFRPSGMPGYAHPLAQVSLMMDCALGGRLNHLLAFHRTNLLLHVMNTVLVIALLYQLFRQPLAAAAAGILFGLHPLAVEPVAWVAQRKALLSASFSLWCLVLYAWQARSTGQLKYLAALTVYALACLSKPSAVPLPVVLLLLRVWPLRCLTWRSLWRIVPFFLVGAAAAAVAIQSNVATIGLVLPSEESAWKAILVACHKVIFALGKILWPSGLSAYYAPPSPQTLHNPEVLQSAVAFCLLASGLLVSLRWTWAFLGPALFFLVTTAPVLGLVQYSWVYMQDSYLYFPALAVLLIPAWACKLAWRKTTSSGLRHRLLAGSVAAILLTVTAAEAVAVRRHLGNWQGRTDIFIRTVRQQPDIWVLHNDLGVLLASDGDLNRAEAHHRRAVELQPESVLARNNLGDALARQGKTTEAAQQYVGALRLAPEHLESRHDQAVALAQRLRLDEALSLFTAVLQIRPSWAEAHNNFANVLDELGRTDQASHHYTEALRLDPGYLDAYLNLGNLLLTEGRLNEAGRYIEEAVRLGPDNAEARIRLGDVRSDQGRFAEAAELYTRALQSMPSDFLARLRLGIAYRELGRIPDAEAAHRRALDLNPLSAEARFNLAYDLELLGNSKSAIEAYRETLRLNPRHLAAAERLNALLSRPDDSDD